MSGNVSSNVDLIKAQTEAMIGSIGIIFLVPQDE
jgi:hypothetical protein